MAFKSAKKVTLKRSADGRFLRRSAETKDTPFEKKENISPLKMFVSIVPSGQGAAITKLLEKAGVNYNVITLAEGTGYKYVPGLLSNEKKQVIFSFCSEDKTEMVCKILKQRFSVSKASSGIAFSVKFTSVMGVSIYRFLSNDRKIGKAK